MHFLIETQSLLSSTGKVIGEQYKIKGKAQAETICHKRDVHCEEPSGKKRKSEQIIKMNGPGHIRGEMYTKILDCLLTR